HRRRRAAPNISAADHHRDLHAKSVHFFDSFGDFAHDGRRNILACAAFLKRLAAQLEYNTFVSRRFGLHRSGNETGGRADLKAKTRVSIRADARNGASGTSDMDGEAAR